MAGMGPPPKPAALRQRRNRASTRATLQAAPSEASARRRAPQLPRHREWHPLTRAWWRDVWRSPMAAEFLDVDLHGLYVLAELVDRFWEDPNPKLAAEIRLQRQCFGLTPIDRRRLQWEVEGEDRRPRRNEPPRPPAGDDPRKLLSVV